MRYNNSDDDWFSASTQRVDDVAVALFDRWWKFRRAFGDGDVCESVLQGGGGLVGAEMPTFRTRLLRQVRETAE